MPTPLPRHRLRSESLTAHAPSADAVRPTSVAVTMIDRLEVPPELQRNAANVAAAGYDDPFDVVDGWMLWPRVAARLALEQSRREREEFDLVIADALELLRSTRAA